MVIYKIINKLNNKIYIGQDSHNNPKYFGSGYLIINAIKKYGKENFTKEILCECKTKEELNIKEKFWIKQLNSLKPNGYNIALGGDGGSGMTGKHHSNKTKLKMKKSSKGQIPWNKGKKNVYSKETIEKMSKIHIGKKFTLEHKLKLKQSSKKRWNNPEERLKAKLNKLGISRGKYNISNKIKKT